MSHNIAGSSWRRVRFRFLWLWTCWGCPTCAYKFQPFLAFLAYNTNTVKIMFEHALNTIFAENTSKRASQIINWIFYSSSLVANPDRLWWCKKTRNQNSHAWAPLTGGLPKPHMFSCLRSGQSTFSTDWNYPGRQKTRGRKSVALSC